jgi:phosphatidylglycerophosphate synthase
MPNDASPPGSSPDFDYRRAVGPKRDDRYILKSLALNRVFNRPAAGLLVRVLYRTKVTPNQVTLASFLMALAGAAFLALGRPWSFAVGGLLAELSSIVDCADGMLARARGQCTEFGASLDLLLDRVAEFFLLCGSVWGWYAATGRRDLLALGLLATAAFFLLTTLFYLYKSYRRDTTQGDAAENRAWLLALIALFGLLGRFDLGIYVLAGSMAVANAAVLALFLRERPAGRPPSD